MEKTNTSNVHGRTEGFKCGGERRLDDPLGQVDRLVAGWREDDSIFGEKIRILIRNTVNKGNNAKQTENYAKLI